ncbi:LEA type 2 family protein [Stutzerimonas stutzeri]|uniref:LEA type 2 family protein n=1 Tax=Stutzerimonas stutzeri TaxID=316 RepID=UPI00210BE66B|nr:LEA type 2 family protein [Stutzerimonas stutzeri]MCQ4321501.1 LEA type 2 family protein [Stutzerimonas stutzeri]
MPCHAPIRRISRAVVLLGLLSGLAGCSTWFSSDFQDPGVQLTDVEIIKARLLEQQFMLRFRIDNPNEQSLPVRGLVYTVHLNDVELASGESSGWTTVPAHGFEYYEVPIYTNLWRHMKYIVRLLEKPDRPIAYRLQGELKTGLMLGRRVHIATNGEIIPGNFIPE